MNIFMSSLDPVRSAIALDDRRLFKMAIESAQLLSNRVRQEPSLLHLAPRLYRASHTQHPLQRWLDTPAHFHWLCRHTVALCDEYTYRSGKPHPTTELLERFYEAATSALYVPPHSHLVTTPKSCRIVPEGIDFTSLPAETDYRHFLVYKWVVKDVQLMERMRGKGRRNPESFLPKWTRRGRPLWYNAVSKSLPDVFERLHPGNSDLPYVKLQPAAA